MANDVISKLTAELNFRIDEKKLKVFEKKLKDMHWQLNKSSERFRKQLNKNTKTQISGLVAVEKRINKHRGQLFQLRQDYQKINNQHREGNISLERRNRLLKEMAGKYSNLKRQMRETAGGGVSGGGGASGASGRSTGGFSGLKAGAVGGTLARMGPGAAVAGAAAVGAGAFMSNEQFQRFESLKSGLTALEGSADAANKKLQELAQMAQHYGQPFMAVGEGFKTLANNLKGTAIEGQTMKIFDSLQAYATAMGLNQQDLSGIQLAVGQIAASGKLQGDEINQLAERGLSREKLAAAMGLSLEEFMKKQEAGDILAKNLLPALANVLMEQARTGGALEQRRTSTQAEQNRALNNAVFANLITNTSGLNYYFGELYKGLQKFVENALPLFEEIGEAFKGMAGPTKKKIEAFGDVLGSIGRVSDSLDGIDIESPFISLSESLKNTSKFLDDIAATIDLLRSGEGWKTKIQGVSTTVVNQLERIAEAFINMAINNVNRLLPKSMELDNVDFKQEKIPKPTVDLSGVNALLGKDLALNVNKIASDNLNRMQYPPNHPLAASERATNITQNISPTIHIDGSTQDANDLVLSIEGYMSEMMRNASLGSMSEEK